MYNQATPQLLDLKLIDHSFKHKLNRIKRQEQFKQNHHKHFRDLTKREIEIVTLLANDFNNPQIAEMLFISRYTVEQHRKNINRKLDVNSFAQLYQYALAFDLI